MSSYAAGILTTGIVLKYQLWYVPYLRLYTTAYTPWGRSFPLYLLHQ